MANTLFDRLSPGDLDTLVALYDSSNIGAELSREARLQEIRRILSRPYRDILSDYVLKDVFLDNPDFVKMFLNDLLPVRVDTVEMLPQELTVQAKGDKKSRVDLVCRTETGERVIIEVQKCYESDFPKRLLFFGSHIIFNQVRSGRPYKDLAPVNVVAIVDSGIPHNPRPANKQSLFHYELQEVDTKEAYPARLGIYILELPRYDGSGDEGGKSIYEWFYFFKNLHTFAQLPKELERFAPIAEAAKTDKVKNIDSIIEYMKSLISEQERELLKSSGYELGVYDGEARGEKTGRADGRKDEKMDNARNLKGLGVSTEIISKALGLSPEAIAAL
ncbi:MAG: Rpn family recombination-promoting nuclease/putative transposase [Bacteroidales bacterium]|nr:Rpn family recombination-promoting nuclease/putative transposase [Bacteroidales bacterium]